MMMIDEMMDMRLRMHWRSITDLITGMDGFGTCYYDNEASAFLLFCLLLLSPAFSSLSRRQVHERQENKRSDDGRTDGTGKQKLINGVCFWRILSIVFSI